MSRIERGTWLLLAALIAGYLLLVMPAPAAPPRWAPPPALHSPYAFAPTPTPQGGH